MTDPAAQVPDPDQSPATDRTGVPVPRIGTPAAETVEESTRGERDAVGDGPDTGGLTPPDSAQ